MTPVLMWRSAAHYARARRLKAAADRKTDSACALAAEVERLHARARAAESRGAQLWAEAYARQKARRSADGEDQAPPWWLGLGILIVLLLASAGALRGVLWLAQ